MKINKYYIIAIALVIAFSSYRLYKYWQDKNRVPEIKEAEKGITEQIIKIQSETQKDVKIQTIQIEPGEFRESIQLIGEVAFDPDRVTKVSGRVSGRVTDVLFIEGTRVNQGQILAYIQSPEVARLKSKYLSSMSKFASTSRNAKRLRELVALRLAGEQEAVNAEADLKILEAEMKADRGNLEVIGIPVPDLNEAAENTGRLEIKAPISGIILSREAVKGMQVDPVTNLATIGNLDNIWFMVKFFEKDLSKVAIGDEAKVKLNSYPDEEFEGRLLYIGNQVDAGSRTVTGRIVVKNKNNLAKIGLFGTAEIFTLSQNVLSVPSDAITSINKKHYVFVEEKPGEYRAKEVKIGRQNAKHSEILEGLLSGEYVVISSLFTLKSALLKSTFGE